MRRGTRNKATRLHREGGGIRGAGLNSVDDNPSEEPIVFSDADIEWFDCTTRELKFRTVDDPFLARLIPFREIGFQLDGQPLFVASTVVNPAFSISLRDLVLYYEIVADTWHFYLNNGYPEEAGDTDEGRANAAARAEAWKSFLNHLAESGRLRE